MDRRGVLQQTALAALGGVTVACGSSTRILTPTTQSVERPLVEWRLTASWPRTLDVFFSGIEGLCARVADLTGGRFSITPYPAGELSPPLQVLDAVQRGTVECGHTFSVYYKDKNLALAFAGGIPFGLTPQHQNTWLYHAGGLELMQAVYSDFNVIYFPAGNTGTQMGGWFTRPANSLEELKTLKYRITGMGGDVLSRLGGNVQILPASEILSALEQGTVDAAEWIGPYDDEKLGFNTVASYYYYPGWHEPGSSLDLLINRAAWDRLPLDYQEALRVAAIEANVLMLANYEASNRQALQRLLQAGVQLTPFSPDFLEAAEQAALEYYQEIAAENESFAQIYSQWQLFRQEILQFSHLNQHRLSQFMMRSL